MVRFGTDILDRPITLRMLIEGLELLRVLAFTPDTYRPGEMEVPCPKCGSVPGEECRPSPNGPRLPSPHSERREAAQHDQGRSAPESA